VLYRKTCSNFLKNYLFAVTLFTVSFLSSTRFKTPRSSSCCAQAYCSSCDVIVFCCFMCCNTVIMHIKIGFYIHPRFVTHVSFENVVWQVAGSHYEYFLFSKKDNFRTEYFHDGSIRDSKQRFFQRNGRLGAGWGNKTVTFLQGIVRAELRNL